MTELTRAQEDRFFDIHNAISTLTRQKGYAPSVKELATFMGMASSSTAHKWLTRMKAEGWVTWEPESPRTLRCL